MKYQPATNNNWCHHTELHHITTPLLYHQHHYHITDITIISPTPLSYHQHHYHITNITTITTIISNLSVKILCLTYDCRLLVYYLGHNVAVGFIILKFMDLHSWHSKDPEQGNNIPHTPAIFTRNEIIQNPYHRMEFYIFAQFPTK